MLKEKQLKMRKKKDREDRIEAVKAVQPLIKIKGIASKKFNFLGGIEKFLGLILAGFILQNLKTIIPILEEIYKKIEDLVKSTKEFIEGVTGGLQTFFEGLDGAKQKMDDLLSPILNADLSKFVPFQDQLDKLLTGILGIAALISGKGGDTLIDEAAGAENNMGSARRAALQRAKKLKQQQQVTRQIRNQQANAFRAIADVAQSRDKNKKQEEAAQKVPSKNHCYGATAFFTTINDRRNKNWCSKTTSVSGAGTPMKPPAKKRRVIKNRTNYFYEYR